MLPARRRRALETPVPRAAHLAVEKPRGGTASRLGVVFASTGLTFDNQAAVDPAAVATVLTDLLKGTATFPKEGLADTSITWHVELTTASGLNPIDGLGKVT